MPCAPSPRRPPAASTAPWPRSPRATPGADATGHRTGGLGLLVGQSHLGAPGTTRSSARRRTRRAEQPLGGVLALALRGAGLPVPGVYWTKGAPSAGGLARRPLRGGRALRGSIHTRDHRRKHDVSLPFSDHRSPSAGAGRLVRAGVVQTWPHGGEGPRDRAGPTRDARPAHVPVQALGAGLRPSEAGSEEPSGTTGGPHRGPSAPGLLLSRAGPGPGSDPHVPRGDREPLGKDREPWHRKQSRRV